MTRLASFLSRFATVFSTGNDDVGRTSKMEHSTPPKEGTRPIQQPSHRLGPKKEAEAERQIQDLFKRVLLGQLEKLGASP